jgi:glycine cleavage system H protein
MCAAETSLRKWLLCLSINARQARPVLDRPHPNSSQGLIAMDPKSLRYAPTHEWASLDGDIATVGISRFAVDQLTDLITIDLPKVGAKVTAGKSFGEVESVKAVSDLYAPVSGEVVEVNSAVAGNVQLLAEDPFAKGWLIKVRVEKPGLPADLLDHGAYEKKIAEEAH